MTSANLNQKLSILTYLCQTSAVYFYTGKYCTEQPTDCLSAFLNELSQVPHSQKICILNSIIRIFNSGIFLFDSDRGSFCPGISNTIYSFVLVVKGQEGLRSSQQSIPESCFTFCGFALRAHPMKWAALPEFMRKHTLESICVFGKFRFIWCQAILPRRSELEEPTLPTEGPAPCGQATAPHWNKLPGTPDCPQWGNRLLKDELDANYTE